MPFETAGVGEGYAAPSEVKKYTMSREEIERRYGKAKAEKQPFIPNLRPRKKKEDENVEKEAEKMTITQAIELHDDLEEEVECLDHLLASGEVCLTKGIKLILDERRCEMAKKLHVLHGVFGGTTVEI